MRIVFHCGWLLLVFGLLLVSRLALAVPAEALVDPRPGSSVLDQTGTLRPENVASIEAAAREVAASGRGELVVVVVGSVDGVVPRTYGTRLFNRWRIGGARSRGVLVLAAIADRRAEIILGDGLGDSAHVAESQAIMDEDMVPLFKRGDTSGAVTAGARASATRLFGEPSTLQVATAKLGGGWGVAGAAGGAAGGSVILLLIGRAFARRKPRRCAACRMPMVRLDEVQDDYHLTASEQTEERVGSVDYDVWSCSCGNVQKLRYGAFFTRYARCPGCHAVTRLKTEEVIAVATETSEGLARIDETCVHCSYHTSTTRTIPRVVASSSDSSSSSFDSGSSGGGGTSSGDGASGSW